MSNAFTRRRDRLLAMQELRDRYVPYDQGVTCPGCYRSMARAEVARNLYVCPLCGHHFPIGARRRIKMLLDRDSFTELNGAYTSTDPLNFPEYREKLAKAQEKAGLSEAVLTGTGRIGSYACAIGALDSRFLMGSMGSVLGEKIALLAEYATAQGLPLIILSASGGARMQEGILSLMQMAKTADAIGRHGEAGLLFISVLTDPTTGGVTASFASLGDVILAEPGALIGFAGPRVIQQTIGQTLPEGFQSAEFQLEHGFVDAVVPRANLRETLEQLLMLHQRGDRV